MYDTTNIYQLYSIINLLSLHIQTVISQKQSASTIPVRPSRVAAPWQLFTMWLARSVACFNENTNVMLQAWNHPCWLFEGNMSIHVLSSCVLNILLLDSLWWRSWNGYCTVQVHLPYEVDPCHIQNTDLPKAQHILTQEVGRAKQIYNDVAFQALQSI